MLPIPNFDLSEKIGKVVGRKFLVVGKKIGKKYQQFLANQLHQFQVKTLSKALDLPKLSKKKLNLKRSGTSQKQETFFRDNNSQNILDKLEVSCQIASYWKSSISVCQEIFASTDKVVIFAFKINAKTDFFFKKIEIYGNHTLYISVCPNELKKLASHTHLNYSMQFKVTTEKSQAARQGNHFKAFFTTGISTCQSKFNI